MFNLIAEIFECLLYIWRQEANEQYCNRILIIDCTFTELELDSLTEDAVSESDEG